MEGALPIDRRVVATTESICAAELFTAEQRLQTNDYKMHCVFGNCRANPRLTRVLRELTREIWRVQQNQGSERELEDFSRRVEPVHHWHRDIDSHEIGLELPISLNRLNPVHGLATDLPVDMAFEHEAETRSDWCIVVDNENSNAHFR
jgi:hypothetical protein